MTTQKEPAKRGDKISPEEDRAEQEGRDDFPIVAVGASAGGLRAYEAFFGNMPASPGMAFVVIQHQDPDQESYLKGLLEKHTDLEVVNIEDGMAAQADRIHIRPPDRRFSIRDGRFVIQEDESSKGLPKLIDSFFFALAEDQAENAICVILSGAGSDGSHGLRAINGAGGLVVAQDEKDAEHLSMPHNAAATGLVDYILPAARMGEKLVSYAHQSRQSRRKMRGESADRRLQRDHEQIMRIVRAETSHDFSWYKMSTIERRIQRRMALHQLGSLSEYAAMLRKDRAEVSALFQDLLIKVTSFFRDPLAYEALEEELDALLADRTAEELRVWVPGCATGEEAYSLAICLTEAMERVNKDFPIRIFATDIDMDNIRAGREAVYPDSIEEQVSPERLQRFFTKSRRGYKVKSDLRGMVIFSIHNVASDSPFSNLDLVSCRNLLIYMTQKLQRKVLPLLHYSLRKGGLLFLGTSEDIGQFSDLFTPVSRKWKIFRTSSASEKRHHEIFSLLGRTSPPAQPSYNGADRPRAEDETPSPPSAEKRPGALKDMVERTIIEEYTPPAVVVDDQNRIRYFHGDTAPYLHPPRGEAVFDLLRMARGELHGELDALLREARKRHGRTVHRDGRVFSDLRTQHVDLAACRIPSYGAEGDHLLLVTFRKQEEELPDEDRDGDVRVAALKRELYGTRQDLQATIEELETTNEELQSTNEELQANNEEMQSTNEELETVNSELRGKNEDLQKINDDMENLFAATDLATVIVDRELRIKRYTPAATRLFRLIKEDRDRPITDIASDLDYEELAEDLKAVLHNLERHSCRIRSREGRWFEVRIIPYRTSNDVIAGAVITFVDVTEQKGSEMAAEEGKLLANAILATLREPLLVLQEDLTVLQANRAFYRFFQVDREETEQHKLFNLGAGQWDLPKLRRLLEEIIPEDSQVRDYRMEGEFPELGRRVMLLNASRIDRSGERPDLILLSFLDVTDRETEEGT